MAQVVTYKDLIVWQKAVELVVGIYQMTKKLPREEIYGLTSQMRRSSVSIPSNIAEGNRRISKKDYKRFLIMAFGSGAELETQIEIAKRLSYVNKQDSKNIDSLLDEVMRILNSMIRNR